MKQPSLSPVVSVTEGALSVQSLHHANLNEGQRHPPFSTRTQEERRCSWDDTIPLYIIQRAGKLDKRNSKYG